MADPDLNGETVSNGHAFAVALKLIGAQHAVLLQNRVPLNLVLTLIIEHASDLLSEIEDRATMDKVLLAFLKDIRARTFAKIAAKRGTPKG